MGIKNRPGCCCGGCPVTFNVTGNAFIHLGGAVCSIWTSSAKTTPLGTAVTDCNGYARIDIPSGSFYWEVDHPSGRLAKAKGSGTCGGTGRLINAALSTITTGYYGLNWSPLPVPGTLHYSDSFSGTVTLTHSGSNWVGTKSIGFSAGTDAFGNACDAVTQDVTYTLVGAGQGTMSVTYKRISPNCGACAGGTSAIQCTGAAKATCASGSYPITVGWFARDIDPTSTTAYTGTVTE